MNSVVLVGRLSKEPELRTSQSGVDICRFSIAVNRRSKQDGQPSADFINCIAFKKTATNIGIYFHKGSRIAVEGHIQTGSYTDRDGKKVYTTDVIVDNFDFIDTRAEAQAEAGDAPQPKAPQQAKPTKAATVPDDGFMSIPDGIDEELPFN